MSRKTKKEDKKRHTALAVIAAAERLEDPRADFYRCLASLDQEAIEAIVVDAERYLPIFLEATDAIARWATLPDGVSIQGYTRCFQILLRCDKKTKVGGTQQKCYQNLLRFHLHCSNDPFQQRIPLMDAPEDLRQFIERYWNADLASVPARWLGLHRDVSEQRYDDALETCRQNGFHSELLMEVAEIYHRFASLGKAQKRFPRTRFLLYLRQQLKNNGGFLPPSTDLKHSLTNADEDFRRSIAHLCLCQYYEHDNFNDARKLLALFPPGWRRSWNDYLCRRDKDERDEALGEVIEVLTNDKEFHGGEDAATILLQLETKRLSDKWSRSVLNPYTNDKDWIQSLFLKHAEEANLSLDEMSDMDRCMPIAGKILSDYHKSLYDQGVALLHRFPNDLPPSHRAALYMELEGLFEEAAVLKIEKGAERTYKQIAGCIVEELNDPSRMTHFIATALNRERHPQVIQCLKRLAPMLGPHNQECEQLFDCFIEFFEGQPTTAVLRRYLRFFETMLLPHFYLLAMVIKALIGRSADYASLIEALVEHQSIFTAVPQHFGNILYLFSSHIRNIKDQQLFLVSLLQQQLEPNLVHHLFEALLDYLESWHPEDSIDTFPPVRPNPDTFWELMTVCEKERKLQEQRDIWFFNGRSSRTESIQLCRSLLDRLIMVPLTIVQPSPEPYLQLNLFD